MFEILNNKTIFSPCLWLLLPVGTSPASQLGQPPEPNPLKPLSVFWYVGTWNFQYIKILWQKAGKALHFCHCFSNQKHCIPNTFFLCTLSAELSSIPRPKAAVVKVCQGNRSELYRVKCQGRQQHRQEQILRKLPWVFQTASQITPPWMDSSLEWKKLFNTAVEYWGLILAICIKTKMLSRMLHAGSWTGCCWVFVPISNFHRFQIFFKRQVLNQWIEALNPHNKGQHSEPHVHETRACSMMMHTLYIAIKNHQISQTWFNISSVQKNPDDLYFRWPSVDRFFCCCWKTLFLHSLCLFGSNVGNILTAEENWTTVACKLIKFFSIFTILFYHFSDFFLRVSFYVYFNC